MAPLVGATGSKVRFARYSPMLNFELAPREQGAVSKAQANFPLPIGAILFHTHFLIRGGGSKYVQSGPGYYKN